MAYTVKILKRRRDSEREYSRNKSMRRRIQHKKNAYTLLEYKQLLTWALTGKLVCDGKNCLRGLHHFDYSKPLDVDWLYRKDEAVVDGLDLTI
jgi:hypothetical protein